MREIKFRAWFNGEMHDEIILVDHQYCIVEKGLGCPLNAGIKDFLAHDDPDTPMILMQFTGLLDKNGVEIYEGDICKQTRFYRQERLVVTCDEAHDWHVKDVLKEGPLAWFGMIDNALSGCEVIGNIHEHPELVNALPQGR